MARGDCRRRLVELGLEADRPPRLWQYNFSNYNEKARWALDFKRVPHQRRSLMPGEPRAMAFSLRGTIPVLDLGGDRYEDSSAIVAALERLVPDPPLYPADPELRRRALAIARDFTDEVGHALRRALFWAVGEEHGYLAEFLTVGQPRAYRLWMRATFPAGWLYARRRYSFNDADAERGWTTLERALDRIEAERSGGEHLVGESFSIADLSTAALLWPLAWPDELQYELPEPPPIPRLEQLREHPGVGWIAATFRRHRGSSAEIRG